MTAKNKQRPQHRNLNGKGGQASTATVLQAVGKNPAKTAKERCCLTMNFC
jgi:hypothetical protein